MSSAAKIKDMVLVASGKGGVGKSTVACCMALAMSRAGLRVGLLDADIYGPSLPTMLGAAARPQAADGKLQPIVRHGLRMMSMGYLVEPDQAMIWRGPMLAGAVSQLVSDVAWGELDVLLLDLPPGTGDIQLTLAQKFKVTGALLVTTPQTVALADVRRAKAMFDKVQIPVLGLVENMSFFVCDGCQTQHTIFSQGGGQRAAAELQVQFFGGVPLEPVLREAGDRGRSLFDEAPNSPSARAFEAAAAALAEALQAQAASQHRAQARHRALPILRS